MTAPRRIVVSLTWRENIRPNGVDARMSPHAEIDMWTEELDPHFSPSKFWKAARLNGAEVERVKKVDE